MYENNKTTGQDAVEHLKELTKNNKETDLIGKQELARLLLTEAMRKVRNEAGLTQNELATLLGVTQSWVSKLESADDDHTFDSVIAYLDAMTAELSYSISWKDKCFEVKSGEYKVNSYSLTNYYNEQFQPPIGVLPFRNTNPGPKTKPLEAKEKSVHSEGNSISWNIAS